MGFSQKWMRYRCFCTWGIQTGPFGDSNSVLPQRVGMRKRDSPKNRWDTGVSVLGAFKLDHLQPVELILSQKMSTFLSFILGAPFSYYCRERGRKKGLTMGKRKSSKSEWDTGVLYLGHSNWTICSLISRFCSLNFPPFLLSYWGVQFCSTPESGNESGCDRRERTVPSVLNGQSVLFYH